MGKSPARRLFLLAAVSAGVLAACGGSDDDSLDDRVGTADPKVRFVHAVPGGPNVTLRRDGNAEAGVANVAYKFANQYYNVGNETYTFSLRTAMGDVELATHTLDVDRGSRYTLVALPTASGVELMSIRDPFNKSVASDDARLRVLNAAVNAVPFDAYVTAVDAPLTTATPALADVTYKEAAPGSGDDSIDLEGGTYRLRLTPTGTKAPFFNATVSVPANGDWLLVVLPEDALPNHVRVLLVRSDDSNDATDEIVGE
jgi:hypothetical protein